MRVAVTTSQSCVIGGCFSVGARNEGGKRVCSRRAPIGNLSHLQPTSGQSKISQVMIVEGWSTAGWNGLQMRDMCCEFAALHHRLLSRCFHVAVHQRVTCISLFWSGVVEISRRMCVHANARLKGPYAPVCTCACICVARWLPLTVIHSFVAWHLDSESGWERQRLRETVWTLHSDSMLAVCLAQIRSTLMNIQQLAVAARVAHILYQGKSLALV